MDNNKGEIWKDIYFIENNIIWDYRGLYQVSNYGRVKSLCNQSVHREKILKHGIRKKYYESVVLRKNNKSKNFLVYRLVAHMFVDGYFDGAEIDHIIPLSIGGTNHADNLCWKTRKGNCNNSLTKENYSKAKKGTKLSKKTKQKMSEQRQGIKHPMARKIAQYSLDGNLIKVWDYIKQAEKQLKIYHISQCCQNKRKSAGGFIWRYYDEDRDK